MRTIATKRCVDDLAVFGGPPAFEQPLHVGRPNPVDRRRLHARLDEILERGWLTNDGPLVREFERRVCAELGVRHCVTTCNATVALQILVRALGLSGEVIVPSFTFVATAHALHWQGVIPVFCDVDPATHCLDPARVEELVTGRTSAVLGVHLWGRPCAVERLAEIAGRRGLSLVFDAAHAFGCSYRGRMIGSFGRAEVLSFHATKFINTFEGGAVVTNDDGLAHDVRQMRDHGFGGGDEVAGPGTNGKMTEIAAAMGLGGLEARESLAAHNRANHLRYRAGLGGMSGLRMAALAEGESSNFHYVVVEVDAAQCGVTRDALLATLRAENVLARRYFHPGCHRVEPYRSMYPGADERLPDTLRLCDEVLVLPTGSSVTEACIDRVTELVRFVVSHAGGVRRRLLPSPPRAPAAAASA